jgi:Insertion element 4 transposase N-terminal/Transposase DDE domain
MAFSGIRSGPVDRGTFDRFAQSIDPSWIEEALAATGTTTLRKRRLPAEQVIWLVLGMALFRNLSIEEVVRQLDVALPSASGKEVVPSAIAQARARLGPAPLRWLFLRTGAYWAHRSAEASRWKGLRLYGVDGTTVRVPDSPENREHFGPTDAGDARGLSGYPLARAVTLMALRSHLLVAADFGPYETGEISYAKELWAEVPDESLTIVDRSFFSAAILAPLARDGQSRHWLIRAKSTLKWTRVARLGPGDELVEMKISSSAHGLDESLPRGGPWVMRALKYKRRGFRPQTLLTSLVDARKYPAAELVELYHERWELELGFDEVKTEMLEREESIRSQRPAGVAQELWGLLLAYNLVRLEMEQVAHEAKVTPSRISFIAALRFIRTTLIGLVFSSPGVIPKRLRQLRADIGHFVLPERRPDRRYPRAVKLKMSSYPRKRPTADRRRWPGAAN